MRRENGREVGAGRAAGHRHAQSRPQPAGAVTSPFHLGRRSGRRRHRGRRHGSGRLHRLASGRWRRRNRLLQRPAAGGAGRGRGRVDGWRGRRGRRRGGTRRRRGRDRRRQTLQRGHPLLDLDPVRCARDRIQKRVIIGDRCVVLTQPAVALGAIEQHHRVVQLLVGDGVLVDRRFALARRRLRVGLLQVVLAGGDVLLRRGRGDRRQHQHPAGRDQSGGPPHGDGAPRPSRRT